MGLFSKKQPEPQFPPQPTAEDMQEQLAAEAAIPFKVQETLGSDRTSFAELLYSPGSMPDIIKHFPALENKVLALTNIGDMATLDWLIIHIDNMKSRYKMFTPRKKQKREIVEKFNELRFLAAAQLMRSMGGKDRDRALWQNTSITTDRMVPPKKRSLFGRITGGGN